MKDTKINFLSCMEDRNKSNIEKVEVKKLVIFASIIYNIFYGMDHMVNYSLLFVNVGMIGQTTHCNLIYFLCRFFYLYVHKLASKLWLIQQV